MGKGILFAPGPFKENAPIKLSQEIDVTPKGHVVDFAVADWDRDGKPDLLVRQYLPEENGKQGIYWFKNLGGTGLPKLAEGKLLLDEEALLGAKREDACVDGFCVCDWNADGWPDLIVTREQRIRYGKHAEFWRPRRASVWLYLRE
jgi:hypothetical protein